MTLRIVAGESELARDRARADRLARLDIGFHHGPQDFAGPLRQLADRHLIERHKPLALLRNAGATGM
jgi:hypothetical protein